MRKDKVNPKKKYPPAYYRYRENHITLSILLSNHLREYLDSMRDEGLTYPEIIKDALEGGKEIHDKFEREFQARLNEEIAKCREESRKASLEERNRLMEEMEMKAGRDFNEDIARIWKELNARLELNMKAQGIILDVFNKHGFSQNEEAFS